MSATQQLIQKQKNILTHLESQTWAAYNKLKKLRKSQNLVISDHAMVRYLERCEGVDIEAIENKLLSTELLSYYKNLGDGTYPINEGKLRVVIKNGVIVTILN